MAMLFKTLATVAALATMIVPALATATNYSCAAPGSCLQEQMASIAEAAASQDWARHVSCSGHGSLATAPTGSACACDPNYAGPTCDEFTPSSGTVTCSSEDDFYGFAANLTSIRVVNGAVRIDNSCTTNEAINALSSVQIIKGSITIIGPSDGSSTITSLSPGLDRLERTTGAIVLATLPGLLQGTLFPNLVAVGNSAVSTACTQWAQGMCTYADIQRDTAMFLNNLSGVVDVTLAPLLRTTDGEVVVANCTSLTRLDSNLQRALSLRIVQNPQLADISFRTLRTLSLLYLRETAVVTLGGFRQLQHVYLGAVSILNNSRLIDVSDFKPTYGYQTGNLLDVEIHISCEHGVSHSNASCSCFAGYTGSRCDEYHGDIFCADSVAANLLMDELRNVIRLHGLVTLALGCELVLPALQEIVGSIDIEPADQAFPNLTAVQGFVHVHPPTKYYFLSFETLFPALETAQVFQMTDLVELTSTAHLKFKVLSQLIIHHCPALVSIHGFENVEHLEVLEVVSTPIASLSGLVSLTSVSNVNVYDAHLTRLDFPALQAVTGNTFEIYGSYVIQDVMEDLKDVVVYNPMLQVTITPEPCIYGQLAVGTNIFCECVTPYYGLVCDGLTWDYVCVDELHHDYLFSTTDLLYVKEFTGKVVITGDCFNYTLSTGNNAFAGLINITEVVVEDTTRTVLFPSLRYVETLVLNNSVEPSFSHFSGLVSAASVTVINHGSSHMSTLSGFPAATIGDLVIENNAGLTDITALHNMVELTTTLTIQNNAVVNGINPGELSGPFSVTVYSEP